MLTDNAATEQRCAAGFHKWDLTTGIGSLVCA